MRGSGELVSLRDEDGECRSKQDGNERVTHPGPHGGSCGDPLEELLYGCAEQQKHDDMDYQEGAEGLKARDGVDMEALLRKKERDCGGEAAVEDGCVAERPAFCAKVPVIEAA